MLPSLCSGSRGWSQGNFITLLHLLSSSENTTDKAQKPVPQYSVTPERPHTNPPELVFSAENQASEESETDSKTT